MGHQLIMMFEIPAILCDFVKKFVKVLGFDGIQTHYHLIPRVTP